MKKKVILSVLAGALMAGLMVGATSCNLSTAMTMGAVAAVVGGNNDNSKGSTTEVAKARGTYSYNKSKTTNAVGETLAIFGDKSKATNGNMYATEYPFNTVEDGAAILYEIKQNLKLKKDFTYMYEYSIRLKNNTTWGDYIASVSVSMEGTFTSDNGLNDGETYIFNVNLNNPTAGTMSINGATVSDEGSIFAWHLNNNATYTYDLETEKQVAEELGQKFKYNRYIKGRKVVVDKMSKIDNLTDDIYFADILNDIAKYSNRTY